MKEKGNIRKNAQGSRKRKALLTAAGKIFAKRGYEGAGVREIAREAKANSGAVVYHFKTKKNLFFETLRYHILENVMLVQVFDVFDEADPSKPQTVSDAIYKSLYALQHACFGKNSIPNLNGLLTCMLVDGGMDVNRMIQELGDNTMAHVFELIAKTNPKLTRTDIFWWSHWFWAHVFYPVFGERLFLSEIGKKSFSEEFLKSLAWRSASQCTANIGLPPPSGIDEWLMDVNSK